MGQPQPEQPLFSQAPSKPPQQLPPHSLNLATPSMPRQQQQGSMPRPGAPSEAEYAGSQPEGVARHERSASGQELGLAMAEQVINAYRLGSMASEATEETGIPDASIPGSSLL